MTENDKSLAEKLYDADEALCELEGALDAAGAEYDRLGWDYYDNSLELHRVAPEHRLSDKAQQVIYDAGFTKAYVNHTDNWETHYSFDHSKPFVPVKGWRVSYPHHRNDEGSIWVEEHVPTWPQNWFDTKYVEIIQLGTKPDRQ